LRKRKISVVSALHVPNPRERETNGGRAKGGRAKGEGWRLMRRPAETIPAK